MNAALTPSSFAKKYLLPLLLTACVVATVMVGGVLWFANGQHEQQSNAVTRSFQASGVIKSFGPAKSYVNIAHGPIEGYMDAMTMAFAFKPPVQPDGLNVGDNVRFTFTDNGSGTLVLTQISRQ